MVERDTNYKLIKEIERFPLLYNFKLAEYSNKVLVEKAWNEVSKKTNMSVADCKEKWRNIRSTYNRSKKAPRRGSRPKKEYYLSRYLGFVLPYVKTVQSTTDPSNISAREEDQILERDNQTQQLQDSEESSDQNDDEVSKDSIEGHASDPFAEPSPMSQKTGRIRKRHVSEADNTLIEYLKEKRGRTETQGTPTHPMHHFFLSLMGEFDTMTEHQMRHFKIRVLQLVDEIKTSAETTFQVSVSPEPSYAALQSAPGFPFTTQKFEPK